MNPSKLDRLTSLLLTAAAVVMAIILVHRELFSSSRSLPLASSQIRGVFDPEWRAMLHDGILVGDSVSPIKIIEFVDLECPVCRAVHQSVLREAKARYGSRLAIWYVHFPLSGHRFARLAAQASECAASRGRFAPFVDVAFAKQDSLGLKSWASYGHDAGINDTLEFVRCVGSVQLATRIDSGSALARRKGLTGTPTFFINGLRFDGAPAPDELFHIADSVLTAK